MEIIRRKPKDKCWSSFSIKNFSLGSANFTQQISIRLKHQQRRSEKNPSADYFRLTQNTYFRIDRFCLFKFAVHFAVVRRVRKWNRKKDESNGHRTWCRILSAGTRTLVHPNRRCDGAWCVKCREIRILNVKNLIYTFPCRLKFICSFVTDINFQHPNK